MNRNYWAIGLVVVVAIALVVMLLASVKPKEGSSGPGDSTAIAGEQIPDITGYVQDGADVLDANTEASLTARLNDFAKSQFGEMAVVTVKSLNGLSVEEFGIRLGEKWKVGRQGKDDGIIVIISSGDRKVRIETGRGSSVTDSQAGSILDTYMVPKLKTGDWNGAVLAGVDALISQASK